VKLKDLEGQLLRYEQRMEEGTFLLDVHDPSKGKVTEVRPAHYFIPVATLPEAHAVSFLCPQAYAKNGGPVGTHSVMVAFEGSPVPPHLCGGKNGPTRWKASGTSIEDMTLTPSIQEVDDGLCSWHGFVTNGDAS
jgi:hypothetical protein